jgi:hypothetical protein
VGKNLRDTHLRLDEITDTDTDTVAAATAGSLQRHPD